MPTLSHISVYPIKALDPTALETVSITEVGGLKYDRKYGIIDGNDDYMHGKRTADIHRLDTEYDPSTNHLRLQVRGDDLRREFHLDRDRAALESWLSNYFGLQVELQERRGGAQTDSSVYTGASVTGPTIISAETIREVASWYDTIDTAEMRLRLRPNLVVEGVPAFWEDALITDGERRLQIGAVTMEGVMPVSRCVVPTRNPHTGAVSEDFRETFLKNRKETLPDWTDRDAFNGNLYSVMVVTRIPKTERGGELTVGDSVRLAGSPVES